LAKSVDSKNSLSLSIQLWIKSGASLSEGTRLFSMRMGADHPFVRLIAHNHQVCYPILIQELCSWANISPNQEATSSAKKPSFREDWPFLALPDCPAELKILAANKITAYYNYVAAHAQLFDCNSIEDMFATVKNCVENYIENRAIIKEFAYYKQHGHTLGIHPIFEELKSYQQLKRLTPLQLADHKRKLEHNIWRIQSEIEKGDKPHLQVEREKRLAQKKNELAEINRLLSDHL